MPASIFIRLLASPIPAKGADLRQQIAALNQGQPTEGVFQADPDDFGAIPGSPFAYWVSKNIRDIFEKQAVFQDAGREARIGLSTKDDFRFLRLTWEVSQDTINNHWFQFAKGGMYSPNYYDLHLLLDWENEGERLKEFVDQRAKELFGVGGWSRWINSWDHYFRPGLTWPRRTTSGISIRTLPAGCIFADKGPAAFVSGDSPDELMALMAVMNSAPFSRLIELQLGAATMAARSYEVGIIQQTPVPARLSEAQNDLAALSWQAYRLARQPSLSDETTHVFCMPAMLNVAGETIAERLQTIAQAESGRQNALASLQAQIDTRVAELYGVPELAKTGVKPLTADNGQLTKDEESHLENDEDEAATVLNPSTLVADLLSWCIGVSFGRWDMRHALHPKKPPALPGPFDPLPVCSPGMLAGADGLPLSSSPDGYPLPIAWDGFLVDDLGHPRDIVSAVRSVLSLLWQNQAEAIETEACQMLGVADLRAWLRDPRGFFAYHIKRYSKSRRKAPIYWLLQSAKRNYSICLYYPRLNPDSLFHAGREYADSKLNLETGHLNDLQHSLASTMGSARKVQEGKIAAQSALAAELKTFQKTLDAAALLEIKPDLNDGVLLNIAPLYELVPWKEAERAWQELLRGKYEWSSIGKRLRQKGLVKG